MLGPRVACLIVLLSAPAAGLAEPGEDLTRQAWARIVATTQPFDLATRYTNGGRKVEGRFERMKGGIRPAGTVRIWYPDGRLHQHFDARTRTLKTYDAAGALLEEDRDALTPDQDSVTTRYYTTGQVRERVVERHGRVEPRFIFTYGFAEKPRERTRMYRNRHGRLRLKEGWHPNGRRHFVARLDLEGPTRQMRWRFFSPDGVERPETRVERDGRTRAGRHYTYWDNGQLESDIEYAAGKQSGRTRRWTASGRLVEDTRWARGYPTGQGARWRPDGSLSEWMEEGRAHVGTVAASGRLTGYVARPGATEIVVGFDAAGRARFGQVRLPYSTLRLERPAIAGAHVVSVKDGRPTGTWRIVVDGRPALELAFDARGRLHGRARQWFPDGRLAVDCVFDHGQPKGAISVWYPDGTPKLRATRVGSGRFEGTYETWFPNGQRHHHEVRGEGQTRIIGRWRADGTVVAREEAEPAAGRHVVKHFRGGTVRKIEYRYPGRKTVDVDTFAESGALTRRTVHIDDDPAHSARTDYWPNGNRKQHVIFRNRKAMGRLEHWHANGQLAGRARYDAKGRQGVYATWNADGTRNPDRHFVDNIEQIGETADPCMCNDPGESVRRFRGPVGRTLSAETLESALRGLRVAGYEATFVEGSGRYDKDYYGRLYNYGPLALVSGAMRILLNPCRHGTNESILPFHWSAGQLWLTTHAVRVEVPETLLRPVGADGPYGIRLDVKGLAYADGTVKVLGQSSACAPEAMVGDTRMRLAPRSARLRFPGTLKGKLKGKGRDRTARVVAGGRFSYTGRDAQIVHGNVNGLTIDGERLEMELAGPFDGPDIKWLARALRADGFRIASRSATRLKVIWSPKG